MTTLLGATQSRVQVTIELGHTASFRKKPTSEGYTHDWTVFVRGPDGSKIQHFIEKVVFHLHETFAKPNRCVKEPPYQVSEKGYASFGLPIDIYFKNKELPRRINFDYDLYLNAEGGPPINHTRCEKLTFQNPTEEFRQKLLKAGGVVHYTGGSGSQTQPFPDLFGPPITPESGVKKTSGSSSSGKDKSSSKPKGSSGSKPSTPQSSHASSVSSSSSSSSGPGPQPIASKEPKNSKSSSSSSSSSSTRETTGQKRPSTVTPPEQTSGKKMKRSSSISSTTESSKHKSHKSSSKRKGDEADKSKKKSSSSKHHKDKSDHKERKKKSESSSSHSKSSSSLSKSLPEFKLKNELLSPLHDSPPRSTSPVRTKPDTLYTSSDSDSSDSPKPGPPSSKSSTLSSMSEDEEEMTMKILAGKVEEDSSSSGSSVHNEDDEPSAAKAASSDSDSDDDIKSTHSHSYMSPKVSKNSSDVRKSLPAKSESKCSPVKADSSKSRHGSSNSKKPFSTKSETKYKDSKDKKEKSESSSTKQSRSSKDTKVPKEKKKEFSKDKISGQVENGMPDKAPNGESIKELLDLQVCLYGMRDRKKLQMVANLIGQTGLFKVTDTAFSFDLCNLESGVVKKIKNVISECQ